MKTRVGIFGGSFDPVHNGHIQIARSFLNSGLIHKLLVLLTPSSPHKEEIEQTEYSHRFAMLKLAFVDVEGAEVSDLEMNLPSPSYTLQTIKHLQKKNPDCIYYLCLGEDSLLNFHKWYRYKEILGRVSLIVARRPGVDSSGVHPSILEKVIFIDHEPVAVSSTAIRQSTGTKKDDLPQPVADYIKKHSLYR